MVSKTGARGENGLLLSRRGRLGDAFIGSASSSLKINAGGCRVPFLAADRVGQSRMKALSYRAPGVEL
jgi:hypothetical protein